MAICHIHGNLGQWVDKAQFSITQMSSIFINRRTSWKVATFCFVAQKEWKRMRMRIRDRVRDSEQTSKTRFLVLIVITTPRTFPSHRRRVDANITNENRNPILCSVLGKNLFWKCFYDKRVKIYSIHSMWLSTNKRTYLS